jgi:hypothetical protein
MFSCNIQVVRAASFHGSAAVLLELLWRLAMAKGSCYVLTFGLMSEACVLLLLLLLQALSVLESLVLPGTDQLDVKDKAAVSVHTRFAVGYGSCSNSSSPAIGWCQACELCWTDRVHGC